MALFTIIATDIFLDEVGVPGRGPFLTVNSTITNAADRLHDKRMNALRVYTVILLCQIVGIFVS